jgi:hypothetical protein
MLEPPDHFTPTEQAIFYVAQYPCERCLLPQLSTTEQFSLFLRWRTAQNYIARCWAARVFGNEDPLYSEMKAEVISRDFYDWAHLSVSYFEALWVLCQLLAPRMAEELAEFGYTELSHVTTALQLFRATVMESTNWQIELSCGYVQIPGRKIDTALKLQAKSIKKGLTKKEALRLQRLSTEHGRKTISIKLLIAMMARYCGSKAVTAQFEHFMLATANLYEKEATMVRKSGSWGWDNGVKLTGTEDGVYIPVISKT